MTTTTAAPIRTKPDHAAAQKTSFVSSRIPLALPSNQSAVVPPAQTQFVTRIDCTNGSGIAPPTLPQLQLPLQAARCSSNSPELTSLSRKFNRPRSLTSPKAIPTAARRRRKSSIMTLCSACRPRQQCRLGSRMRTRSIRCIDCQIGARPRLTIRRRRRRMRLNPRAPAGFLDGTLFATVNLTRRTPRLHSVTPARGSR